MADRDPQPAFRLRSLRPQFRTAHAAQFLVQQLARLVPGVRGPGHANRRQPGGPAARSQADARRRRGRPLARWPASRCSARCSAALSAHAGVPLDVPFDQLTAKQRRVVLHGTGDEWIDVFPAGQPEEIGPTRCFAFNSRGSIRRWRKRPDCRQRLRSKWEHLVDEVECSTCGGSRLRDDASAVRLHGRTIDELCRQPLGELLSGFPTGSSTPASGRSPANWCAK